MTGEIDLEKVMVSNAGNLGPIDAPATVTFDTTRTDLHKNAEDRLTGIPGLTRLIGRKQHDVVAYIEKNKGTLLIGMSLVGFFAGAYGVKVIRERGKREDES